MRRRRLPFDRAVPTRSVTAAQARHQTLVGTECTFDALQEAFGALLGGDDPAEQVKLAKAALKALPWVRWTHRIDKVGG